MNKQLAVAAFIAALSFAADAGAHAHAQLNPGGARCNGCHTGGRPPTPGSSPGDNASRVGAGFQITGGKRAQILLDVVTQPNQGLGLAVTVGDGLTIESTRSDMRVERQML